MRQARKDKPIIKIDSNIIASAFTQFHWRVICLMLLLEQDFLLLQLALRLAAVQKPCKSHRQGRKVRSN